METSDKIIQLENEIKVLKNEVQAVLLDIRENVLNAENPFNAPKQPVSNQTVIDRQIQNNTTQQGNDQKPAQMQNQAPAQSPTPIFISMPSAAPAPVMMPAPAIAPVVAAAQAPAPAAPAPAPAAAAPTPAPAAAPEAKTEPKLETKPEPKTIPAADKVPAPAPAPVRPQQEQKRIFNAPITGPHNNEPRKNIYNETSPKNNGRKPMEMNEIEHNNNGRRPVETQREETYRADDYETEMPRFELGNSRASRGQPDLIAYAGLACWVEDTTRRLGKERTQALLELAEVAGLLPTDVKTILTKLTTIKSTESTNKPSARDYFESLVKVAALFGNNNDNNAALLMMLTKGDIHG